MSDNGNERERDGNSYQARADKSLDERLEELEKLLGAQDDEIAAATDASAVNRRINSGFELLQRQNHNKVIARSISYRLPSASFRRLPPNVHDGHRQRLRSSIKDDKKLGGFGDIRLLEVLLSFFIPQKDTNVTAHALMTKFGSLMGVLTATSDELIAMPTITASAASALPMLAELCLNNGGNGIKLARPSDVAGFFGAVYRACKDSCMFVAYLDRRYRLINVERHENKQRLPVRAIADSAHSFGARYVLAVRRDDSIFPAEYDLADRVFELSSTLAVGGVRLLDFLMFTDYGYYTLGDPPKDGEWYVKYMFVPSEYNALPQRLTPALPRVAPRQKSDTRILNGLSDFSNDDNDRNNM